MTTGSLTKITINGVELGFKDPDKPIIDASVERMLRELEQPGVDPLVFLLTAIAKLNLEQSRRK